MKISTALVLILGIAYGLYVAASAAFAANTAQNLEQCQNDIIARIKAGAPVGHLASVSPACASTEAAYKVIEAVLR